MDKNYEDSKVLRHYGDGAFDGFAINSVILTSQKRQEWHTGLMLQDSILIIDVYLIFSFHLKSFHLGDLNNFFMLLAFFLIY